MAVRFIILFTILTLALSGCQRIRKGYDMMEEDARIAINGLDTKYPPKQMADTPLNYPENTPGEQHEGENSYCYKVLTDILCYTQPIPGKDHLMVGYQVPKYRVDTSQRQANYYAETAPQQPVRIRNLAPQTTGSNNRPTSASARVPNAPRELLSDN